MKKLILTVLAVVLFTAASAAQAPKSNWAEYDGGKVHYFDIGKGRNALVLIHGWTCDAGFWKDSYSAFPKHRVIVIDLPGHGRSDKPRTNYTMDYFAKSLDAVLKKARFNGRFLSDTAWVHRSRDSFTGCIRTKPAGS